jgi:SagB-type dehydrogenase family enzyme
MDGDVLHLTAPWLMGLVQLTAEDAGVAGALAVLANSGATWNTMACAAARCASAGVARLGAHIETLQRHQMVEHVWWSAGVERAVVTATVPGFTFETNRLDTGARVALSRFAYARRDRSGLVLESPEANCRLAFRCGLTWDAAGVLASPVSMDALRGSSPHAAELAELLWHTRFLERVDAAEPHARRAWEFQDLLFHWSTREGRSAGAQGATFRFADEWPSPPAVKPPMSTSAVSLPGPADWPDTPRLDLIDVIEQRRSRRRQGATPVGLDHIARLLYHTARVKQHVPAQWQELLLRPVPAAGAIHELEFYVVVHACAGIAPGLYHYHSVEHALYRLPASPDVVRGLTDHAAAAWGQPDEPPQVLIVVASRVPRIAWKYEGIAYRLSLLNAGASLQSLYLLATEMDLACSALGGGDSAAFAAATGLDPYEETSIAEFAVGSRHPSAESHTAGLESA